MQTDANHHTTSFAFDPRGRPTRRTVPDASFETKAYDAAGELSSRTDFMGRTTTYAYDALGRMLSRTYPDTSSVAFTYTPTGQLATATDARGVTHYTYDVTHQPRRGARHHRHSRRQAASRPTYVCAPA